MSSPSSVPGAAMPLSIAKSGEQVVCVRVEGGPGLERHMAAMGILAGAEMTVVSGGGSPGPIVVKVRTTKYMLGRGMAHRVFVRPR